MVYRHFFGRLEPRKCTADTIVPKNQRGIHERWTRHTTDVGLSRKFAETFNFDLSLGVCIQRLCKPLIIQKKMFGGWCFAPEPDYRGASMGDSLGSEEPTTLKHLRMHQNPISTRYFISCIWGKSLKLLRTDVVFWCQKNVTLQWCQQKDQGNAAHGDRGLMKRETLFVVLLPSILLWNVHCLAKMTSSSA